MNSNSSQKKFDVIDKNGTKHPGLALERLDIKDFRADVTVFRLWSDDLEFGPLVETSHADDLGLIQEVSFLGSPSTACLRSTA